VLDQSGAASVRDDQVIIARILASGTSLKPKLRAEAEKWMSNVAATPEDKLLRAARAEDRKEFWELADEHSFPAQPVPADLDTAALKYAHDGGADAVRSRAVIEKGVLRLAAVLGADRERVQTELGKVPHGGGDAWTFLGRAFEQVGPFLWTKRAEQLKSRWLRSYVVPLTHELRKELARAQKQLRKSRQYYNEKGKAAIDTGELVLAEDADLWLLAPREGGGRQLVHTHPEGTWVLSEHPVALLEEAIASVSPKTKAKAKATATTKAKAKAPAKTKASAAGKKPKR
jgi:hypothetical protein